MDIHENNIITPSAFELMQEAEQQIRITRESKILSLGCGRGGLESYIAGKYGCSVIGIDINPDYIREALKNSSANIHFAVHDAASLDYPDESFNFVLICGAFANFPHIVPDLRRIIKNGGAVILIELLYREGVLPLSVIEKWSKNRELELLKPVSAEYIESQFFSRNFYKQFSKKLPDLGLWDAYYATRAKESEIIEEREILSYHCSHIGLGLYVFGKLTYTTYDI